MPEINDFELLAQFARDNSETAFAALIERYVNLVYSVALRRTGNPHAAEEITQVVFIILARKAKSLSAKTILPGWLHQAARLTAANYLRAEMRRRRHEQEAYMEFNLTETAHDEAWRQLAPHLDEAIGRLRAQDRDALILRYFENKSLREVGAALGLEERAAQKRVNRAVEKLRHHFSRRGVGLTTAIIAGVVSVNAIQAAPVGLTATIAVTAVKGSTIAASTLALVKGTMKMITWVKLKFTMGVSLAVLLASGAATVAVSQISGAGKMTPQEIARKSQEAYAALSSYSDNGTVVSEGAGQTTTTTFKIRLQRPNLYRIDWTSTGGFYTSKGAVWSAGTGNFFKMGAADQWQTTKPEKMHDRQMALAAATGVSGTAAATIPAEFFKQAWGNALGVIASRHATVVRLPDEKTSGVDCYVITSSIGSMKLPDGGQTGKSTTTFWIGKQDYLIYRTRTTSEGFTSHLEITDADIKTILARQNKATTPEAIAALRAELEKSKKLAQNGKFVFTQTHENISVNRKFPASDFTP